MNTRRELDHAQNQAEPENQAWLVPGPDPDQIKNFKIFFQKIKSATMQMRRLSGPTIVGQADHCGSLWYVATYLFPHPLGYDMIGDYYDCWRSDKPKCVEA